MNREEYDRAASFWRDRESAGKRMEPARLFAKLEEFLISHNTCALATGSGTFVRCTPVEYEYFGRKLWILTEGGLKFAALKDNRQVSAAVYEPYTGFDSVKGIQITGTAQVAEPGSREYEEYQEHRKEADRPVLPLPAGLHLLVIHPKRMEGVFGEFLQMGYPARQAVEMAEVPDAAGIGN